MTGMKKPAFPPVSLIVQAAMAAVFLVGVTGAARAQAVINQDDGGLVQWTIGMNGVSSAPGVSAVNLSGLGFTGGSGSWSNGSVSVSTSGPWTGGVISSARDTPSGIYNGPSLFVDSDNIGGGGTATPAATGTATLTLSSASGYFGALVNSMTSSVNTLAFYNGTTLVDSINITDLGTYIPHSIIGGAPDYASYLNIDFLGGVTYGKVVLTESGGTANQGNAIALAEIATLSSPVSLSSLTSDQAPSPTPLPALGGTAMGLLALAGGALRCLTRGHRTAV
jgi:hypothetical protein